MDPGICERNPLNLVSRYSQRDSLEGSDTGVPLVYRCIQGDREQSHWEVHSILEVGFG